MIKHITGHFSPKYYLLHLLLGLTALFGFYLIIAWSGYTPLDNSWATSGFAPETINKAGAFGAWFVDLFFVFFGYIGNLIPFILFFIPVYLIRSKRVESLTWIKFALRSFGFILLLCGLTMLATLSLNNPASYLAGGVLGGSLTLNLYPSLGKFGVSLLAVIFAVVGFIFCSGASFIRLLMKFYRWLTMQNPPEDLEKADETESEEAHMAEPLEEIVIGKTPAQEAMEQPTELVNPADRINISGLSKAQDMFHVPMNNGNEVNAFAPENPEFVKYDFEQREILPNVSISMQRGQAELSTQQDFTPAWQQTNAFGEEKSAVDFGGKFATSEDMPSVSLAEPAVNVAEEDPEQSELARQFAAQEQQRLREMEQRAKDMGVQDVYQQIVQEPTAETALKTANYRPYGNSLIHPAFQQHKKNIEKPTTPLPSLDLLEHRPIREQDITQAEIVETSQRIEQQLRNFNVKAKVKDVLVGPVVTRYELELDPGVKASKVTGLDTDLARALMFRSIRVAEVIPGKPYIGIETPNDHRQIVPLRDVLDSDEFRNSKALLSMALGKDISGKPMVVDLAKMPHLLVAGTTGSGKSVGVNTMILSLLYRVKPEEVKFIMIDPKVVELSIYNDIPHLLTEVVTDMKKAANALRWCVDEMERRYQLLSALRVRNIEGFNEKVDEYEALNMPIPNPLWKPGDSMDTLPPPLEKLSYIVVIVDEFADLMMVAGKQVEELIARLAQKARAVGIHLILATQRPSVDVITGLIKANVPSRIAFTVATKIDSRTILDAGGAESLLGKGDMLYSPQGSTELVRIHGAFMTDDEVVRVVDDWKARGKPNYIDGILEGDEEDAGAERLSERGGETDGLFDEVVEFVVSTGTTSISAIQRRFRVGFNRAANIMDQLEEQGIVSPVQNGKREVLARGTDY
ncbi:DNA translocase FtsK [Aggregatibacter actinomycetemcomitans]|uniref:DNA translocase FtsK n=1 Tax=Aggregatibacter actinomycetemcomitans TaxID=714 RepID=UPI00023FFCE9|nr:DNA translocase FtsK [Aggregatibacter actinomycetemcomitans]EHK89578.1 outer-membrane lipoprotein carrier protein [Aggregatibacter actinomycetemcomitans RhAA1]KNE76679.1 cell division protein FtsK [Aggregatibacter actinomycetemcomitans RhAA1]MBN6078893.1 DNA translocase FtsK 4TM domain-containing protein [Aggregatibacter actinomycetemcomitans]